MAYILNTPINDNKKCVIALTEIFGLGPVLIEQICDQLGCSAQIQMKQLNTTQRDHLTRCISQNYICTIKLREAIRKNKEQHVSISSYRGFRYIEKLPCRGQRTHGNAQTARRCNLLMMSESMTRKKKKGASSSIPFKFKKKIV